MGVSLTNAASPPSPEKPPEKEQFAEAIKDSKYWKNRAMVAETKVDYLKTLISDLLAVVG